MFSRPATGSYGFLHKREKYCHPNPPEVPSETGELYAIDIVCDDTSVAETNITLAACLLSNTNVSVLQTAEQATTVCFYVIGHMCKGEGGIRVADVGLTRLRLSAESGGSENFRRLVNCLACACVGGQEIASSIGAYILLGNGRFEQSHEFQYFYPFRVLNEGEEQPLLPTPVTSESESSTSAASSQCESDSPSPGPAYNFVNGETFDALMRDDVAAADDLEQKATLTFDRGQWRAATDEQTYALRPLCLSDLSYLEFMCVFTLVKRTANMKRCGYFKLLPEHPQSSTHVLRVRVRPRLPILASGNPPRRPKDDEVGAAAAAQRLKWSRYWAFMLFPWRNYEEWKAPSCLFVSDTISKWSRRIHAPLPCDPPVLPSILVDSRCVFAHFCIRTTRMVCLVPTRHARYASNGLRMSNADKLDDSLMVQKGSRDIADDLVLEHSALPQTTVEQHFLSLVREIPLSPPNGPRVELGKLKVGYTLNEIRLHNPPAVLPDRALVSEGSGSGSNLAVRAERLILKRLSKIKINKEQRKACRTITRAISQSMPGTASPTGFVFWPEGKAGCGKTHATQALLGAVEKTLGSDCVAACAFQGVTAQNLWPRGRTLHSFFGISSRRTSNEREATVPASALEALTLLVIDEISLVQANLLDSVNVKLQRAKDNTLPFGGCVVVCLGDFYQLDPVGGTSLLKGYFSSDEFRMLWGPVQRITLTTDMRSGPGSELSALSTRIRSAASFDSAFLNGIQLLSAADLQDVSSLTTVHATNDARISTAFVLLQRFALNTGNPLVIWSSKLQRDADGDLADRLARDIPGMTEFFCRGARCVLTHNICTEMGLCNGTKCFYHDIEMESSHVHYLSSTPVDGVIRLPPEVRPRRVIVAVPVSDDLKLPSKFASKIVEHGGSKCWLVPLLKESIEVTIPARFVKNKRGSRDDEGCAIPRKLHTTGFKCTQGYCFTFHSIQGQTLDSLVLDLSRGAGRISWESIYVGITRVRALNQLRLIKTFDSDFSFLDGLTPNSLCSAYYRQDSWTIERGVATRTMSAADLLLGTRQNNAAASPTVRDFSECPSVALFSRHYERSCHYTTVARLLGALNIVLPRLDVSLVSVVDVWLRQIKAVPRGGRTLIRPHISFPGEGIGTSSACFEDVMSSISRFLLSSCQGQCLIFHDRSYAEAVSLLHASSVVMNGVAPRGFVCRAHSGWQTTVLQFLGLEYRAVAAVNVGVPNNIARVLGADGVTYDAVCLGRNGSWWWYVDGDTEPRRVTAASMGGIRWVCYGVASDLAPDPTS